MGITVNKPQFDTEKLVVGKPVMVITHKNSWSPVSGIIKHSSPLKLIVTYFDKHKNHMDDLLITVDQIGTTYEIKLLVPLNEISDQL